MRIPETKSRIIAACLAGAAVMATMIGPVTPASAQFGGVVFDPSNYAQNVLTAARTLQQINNQIQSLQNEAQMLTNMAKQLQRLDFSSLQQISTSMQKVGTLMNQAQGIAMNLSATETALRDQYPNSFDAAATTSQTLARAQTQWQSAMDAYRQTMRVQAQVVENVGDDAGLLATLVTQSQSAVGSVQVGQAANQLQALAIKQQMQVQQMMAAQYRADALERARQAQALEAARAATRTFIGGSSLYTRP
ncbi:MAG: P-type conjugative transfer protein TrbJ [Sphingomonas sp. 66-10]|uniref:P-type conjugative transfer protein TrbJ n=1 Tax=Sphingomonas sp. 66-10 TaxID=1895848 RepID=UPI00086D85DF|nr:P-type conjugative transfer protein TrbJ [Sphingomonas sp. 66-10]ODU68431.1 MAG: P-type conjugative transfer protein TrbJ [Novosphingobium sp. SCN 66-18]OJU18201.1 MAG: P-type conjugative transfer protein TrbJ [Sphingomonas sp. 66-10]